MTTFQKLLTTHLIDSGLTISGGGVRYGSVIYLGFGDTWTENLRGRWEIRRFAAEVEFGADEWAILVDGKSYLSSDRPDLHWERNDIDEMFVGGRLWRATYDDAHFDLLVSGGITIRSIIKPDHASGFLFTLSLRDESYETLDGKSLVA